MVQIVPHKQSQNLMMMMMLMLMLIVDDMMMIEKINHNADYRFLTSGPEKR